ncbi:MAG TPA: UDP-N-acetylmuramate dehydrogenase [Solirubrobacteraceae bacterium]|nr:UDP-N-acetylmuramate dehydrogenase [Solirubrobacteraceae bacterium]
MTTAIPLSELTTLRLGGPAARMIDARSEEELVSLVRAADDAGEPLLVLAGGSNVVVADAGFAGTVVRVATRGLEQLERSDGRVWFEVQAGEEWDALVAMCVDNDLAGVEALSGIPGSVGATPIQNVGAYGQEVADVIAGVRALDRDSGEVYALDVEECLFDYRSSIFKRDPDRWVVLCVTFACEPGELSEPVRYAELARRLRIDDGDRAPLSDVRAAVLELRRGKGMVLDATDPDTVSVGSFFTNPVLREHAFAQFAALASERLGPDDVPPSWPAGHHRDVKTAAAWLIERAGFGRGYGNPGGIAISSKHTLALTNRGAGTTAELVTLAREIAAGVHTAFGVELVPEPVFVGHSW